MIADIFNLVAAILCTIGAGIGTVALFLSEPTSVNVLAAYGSLVATLGGCAWLVAATQLVVRRK